jgi:hypothetical protein
VLRLREEEDMDTTIITGVRTIEYIMDVGMIVTGITEVHIIAAARRQHR